MIRPFGQLNTTNPIADGTNSVNSPPAASGCPLLLPTRRASHLHLALAIQLLSVFAHRLFVRANTQLIQLGFVLGRTHRPHGSAVDFLHLFARASYLGFELGHGHALRQLLAFQQQFGACLQVRRAVMLDLPFGVGPGASVVVRHLERQRGEKDRCTRVSQARRQVK